MPIWVEEKCTNSETPYQTKPPTQNFPKGPNNKKIEVNMSSSKKRGKTEEQTVLG